MKIIFRIVKSPSISEGSSDQAFIIKVIKKIAHQSIGQPANLPPRNNNPLGRRTDKPQPRGPLLPDPH